MIIKIETTYLFGLMLFIAGCWQPLDQDIPGFNKELVVQSTLSPDNIFNLSLSMTQSVIDPDQFEPILEADVKIFSEQELVAQLLIPGSEIGTEGPMFRFEGQKPEIGVIYDLQVEVEGYPMLEASTQIPEQVRVSSVDLIDLKFDENFEDRNLKDINIVGEILVDNTNPGDHFYHLSHAELIFDWYTVISGDTIFQEDKDSMLLPIENIDFTNDNFIDLIQDPGFLISHEGSNSSYLKVPFKVSTQINPSNQVLSHLNLYLRNTASDYYKFHSSVTNQKSSNSINSEPVPIHSNVINGQGHFSGYSTTIAQYLFR